MPLQDLPGPVAIFGDRLVFAVMTRPESMRGPFRHPETGRQCVLFSLDKDMAYAKFHEDHGPLNLSMTFDACIKIHEKLEKKRTYCLYTDPDPEMKSNMTLVVCLYFLIVAHWTPSEAFSPIAHFELMPFRDAGHGFRDFALSDCLYGMWKAIKYDLVQLEDFDPDEYQYLESPANGDMNLLGPFIPFASPVIPRGARTTHGLRTVLRIFEREQVGLVVRLNDELYDRELFVDRGMDHVDLYFDDGTCPNDAIVREFIRLADTYLASGKKVAVHCKAGLGRTGVLIGAYLIYKYSFTATEVMGYMRVVRPGMVVGPQQQYMLLNQHKWIAWAACDEYVRQQQPVNPLATPPLEPCELPTLAAPMGASVKAGDARGQPRKAPSSGARPHETAAVDLDSAVAVSGSTSSQPSTRGTKRGATRAPIPQFINAGPPATPTRGVHRSTSSCSSLASDFDQRATKRRPEVVLSPLGLSSPPPSREVTPDARDVAALITPLPTRAGIDQTDPEATPRATPATLYPRTPSGSLIPTRRPMRTPVPRTPLPQVSVIAHAADSSSVPLTLRAPHQRLPGAGKAPVAAPVSSPASVRARPGAPGGSKIPAPIATVASEPNTPRKVLGITTSRVWNSLSRMAGCELTHART
ncbi:cell division control protein 14 [Cryptotrichosporon argae]